MSEMSNHSSTDPDPAALPYSFATMAAVTAVAVILMIFGVLGNLITVVTIRSTTKLQTVSNYLICSICVADLISMLICAPLWLMRSFWNFQHWKLGRFLCKFYWVTEVMTCFITVFDIASFAGLRLYAIRNPYSSWSVFKRNIFLYIMMSWMFAISCSMPFWIFTGVHNGGEIGYPSCSVVKKGDIKVLAWIYMSIFAVPGFLLDLFTILIVRHLLKQQRWFQSATGSGNPNKSKEQQSASKWEGGTKRNTVAVTSFSTLDLEAAGRGLATKIHRLKNKKKSTRRRQQRTFVQLSLVVASFTLGYLPLMSYFVYTPFKKNLSTGDQWFHTVAFLCLRISECLNPIMYNLGSHKLRKNTKTVVGKIYRNTFIRRRDQPARKQEPHQEQED